MKIRTAFAAFAVAALFAAGGLTGCYEKETEQVPSGNPPVVNNVEPSKPDVHINVPPPASSHSESSSTTVEKNAPGMGTSSSTTTEHHEVH